MRRCWAPGIPLAVDNRQPRVTDVETAVFVNGGYVWRGVDVETVVADETEIREVVGSAPER